MTTRNTTPTNGNHHHIPHYPPPHNNHNHHHSSSSSASFRGCCCCLFLLFTFLLLLILAIILILLLAVKPKKPQFQLQQVSVQYMGITPTSSSTPPIPTDIPYATSPPSIPTTSTPANPTNIPYGTSPPSIPTTNPPNPTNIHYETDTPSIPMTSNPSNPTNVQYETGAPSARTTSNSPNPYGTSPPSIRTTLNPTNLNSPNPIDIQYGMATPSIRTTLNPTDSNPTTLNPPTPTTPTTSASVSLNIKMEFVAANDNKVGIKYDESRFSIMYKGIPLGRGTVRGFYQPAHSVRRVETNIVVDRVSLLQSDAADLIRDAALNDRVALRVVGDVGAKIRILGFTSPGVQVSVDCEIVISPRKQALTDKRCGFDGVSV
ncbi:hypothetical protein LIER_34139 [Lithospermum erythrorhizon]|uniref:Late embryogenesis abundant protein LEA-2 subgroup domain-containing protein n=1 Tax=Lithospermum erythrorhizon TaxID=34254 RepID=A0AAV3S3Q1_LITER